MVQIDRPGDGKRTAVAISRCRAFAAWAVICLAALFSGVNGAKAQISPTLEPGEQEQVSVGIYIYRSSGRGR